MTGETSSTDAILTATALIFEGALTTAAYLVTLDEEALAEIHDGAAAAMIDEGRFVEMAQSADDTGHEEAEAVTRRAQSYYLAMLAVERATDVQNPGAQPPMSEHFRAAALANHPELNQYIPKLTIDFTPPSAA